jgi:aspartyl-tRNA(Asn)/glutamyl-tRNA(Gln) amidotransferase subunit A
MSSIATPLLPLTELSRLVASGEVSPVELTEAYLDRAKRYARLNAYVTLDESGALSQARASEAEIRASKVRGPLHGLPIAVKDQLDVAGVRTTAGSKLVDYVATRDSTAVARLREAGAVILGKLNMSEFALGGNITHPYGVPHNPWDETRQAGQSSSGSGIAVGRRCAPPPWAGTRQARSADPQPGAASRVCDRHGAG